MDDSEWDSNEQNDDTEEAEEKEEKEEEEAEKGMLKKLFEMFKNWIPKLGKRKKDFRVMGTLKSASFLASVGQKSHLPINKGTLMLRFLQGFHLP